MLKFITIHEDGSMTYTQKTTDCLSGMIRFEEDTWTVCKKEDA